MTKEAFIHVVTTDQPEAPPYFTYDAVLNGEERPTLDDALGRAARAHRVRPRGRIFTERSEEP
jgi:hypothetical protein